MVVQTESVKVSSPFLLSPMMCAMYLLLITCWICWLGFRQGRVIWLWDVLLFGAQGLGGCLIAALFFFSVHPAVGSNWLVIVFNPLPLLMKYWMISSRRLCQTNWLWRANLAVLLVFVIAIPVIPQSFNPAMIPLVLTLLLRSASGEVVVKMKSRGRKK